MKESQVRKECLFLLTQVDSEEALIHWLGEQDYLVNEDGSPVDQDLVKEMLYSLGANEEDVLKIMNVINEKNDL